MKKILSAMFLVAVASLLVAFAGPDDKSKKLVGKWQYSAMSKDGKEWNPLESGDDIFEIKADGTFVFYDEDEVVGAKWSLKGDELTIWYDDEDDDSVTGTLQSVTDKEMVIYFGERQHYEKYKRIDWELNK